MSVENSLRKFPFNLTHSDVSWVTKTRDDMSTAQKIRQLFVHVAMGDDAATTGQLASFSPGGIHRFMGPDLDAAWTATRAFMERCEIPPFMTADLEGGGNHAGPMTPMTNQLGLAAANDLELSTRAVNVMAREAAALGVNWTFTPCVDINSNPGSAIVGTRSYGSDQATILKQAEAHMQAMQAHGIAATAKHWPGEGLDWRDQHLVTTINPLGAAAWEQTFGTAYRSLIAGGLLSVMSAHIALPDYLAGKGIADGLERYRPASLSKHLNFDLLRGELGFNGLVVSDATPMAGLGSWAGRAEVVPQIIENGCDVFLFCANMEADIAHMEWGMRSGALSEQRLEDAITRILGLKAALGLHRKTLDERLLPLERVKQVVRSAAHLAISREVADRSATLVKDTQKLLPLNPAKHRRICWISQGAPGFLPHLPNRQMNVLRASLADRGFVVSDYNPDAPPTLETTDLVLYVMAEESSLGKSRIFLNWRTHQPGLGNMMTRYWHDIPTLLVSFGHPYYLQDVPRMPTCVNAYSIVPDAQRAVAERLMGNAEFEGVSPVDAFAGAPDARY